MTYGLKITNDDGYVTLADTHSYLRYEETLTSSNATYMFGNRYYWTTTYSGSSYPLVFIYSNGYWASIIDTFRNTNGTWQIHVWTANGQASSTLSNVEAYVFTSGSEETGSDPTYGIRINDSSGNRVYNSDFILPRIKGFSTIPAINAAAPSCSDSGTSAYNQTSVTHGVSGLTKPAATFYANGYAARNCTGGFKYWRVGYKITSTQILGGWVYGGQVSGWTTSPSPNYIAPSSFPAGVIDGNDY